MCWDKRCIGGSFAVVDETITWIRRDYSIELINSKSVFVGPVLCLASKVEVESQCICGYMECPQFIVLFQPLVVVGNEVVVSI